MPGDGIANILATYAQATKSEVADGHEWYFAANSVARKLAKSYKVDVPRAASVIAALSPNIAWDVNVEAADLVFAAWAVGKSPDDITVAGYGANKLKAFALAEGKSREEFLRGLKVNSFYNNIVSPATSTSVTVDRHAYSCWHGSYHTDEEVPSKIFRPKWYNAISQDYREVAGRLGIKPWQCQATCWLTWKRLIDEPEWVKGEAA